MAKVMVVKYESQADARVCEVGYESQADLCWYEVGYGHQAQGEAMWQFVEYDNLADFKIFRVKYENQADIKICKVKYPDQAGWKNNHKLRGRIGNAGG